MGGDDSGIELRQCPSSSGSARVSRLADACGTERKPAPSSRVLVAYKVGPTVMPAETILLSHTWYSLSSMLSVMGWAGISELLE